MTKVFTDENCTVIETNVLDLLRSSKLTDTISSPRAVGDTVQSFLEERFITCIPKGLVKDFSASFARRAMADFAFTDIDDNYYIIDNKTHNMDTKFNMPNLTSVERLARLYHSDIDFFTLLIISYKTIDDDIQFEKCIFAPIEHMKWEYLTIGALGWGQIQIKNSNFIEVDSKQTRRSWMLNLCDNLDLFYPNEIRKITDRIDYFKKERDFWEKHENI